MTKTLEEMTFLPKKEPSELKEFIDDLEKEFDACLDSGEFVGKERQQYIVETTWLWWNQRYSGIGHNVGLSEKEKHMSFRYLEKRYEKAGWKRAEVYLEEDGDLKKDLIYLKLKLTPKSDNGFIRKK